MKWLAASVLALVSCAPPCEPGSAWVLGDGVQALGAQRPVLEFGLFSGNCRVKRPEASWIEAIGESGERVEVDAEVEDLPMERLEPDEVVALRGTIAFREVPSPGWWTIRLKFASSSERVLRAYFAAPEQAPTHAVLNDARCLAPFRVTSSGVICRLEPLDGGDPRLMELTDGGSFELPGSRLWRTSVGNLVTTADAIGWIPDDAHLSNWRGVGFSFNGVDALTADDQAVVAVSGRAMLIFDRALQRAPEQRELHIDTGRATYLAKNGNWVAIGQSMWPQSKSKIEVISLDTGDSQVLETATIRLELGERECGRPPTLSFATPSSRLAS